MKVLSTATSEHESAHQSFFKRPIELLRKSSTYEPPDVKNVDEFDLNNYKKLVLFRCFPLLRFFNDFLIFRRSPLWIGQVWLLIQRSMLNLRRSYRAILVEIAWYIVSIALNLFAK